MRVKASYEGGYLTFSEEVEGEVGIYYAGKRLRDYTMIRKYPMLALYTVYVGDQVRYLNYFKKERDFRGDRVQIKPLYGGYILNDSEEGVVFGRCVRVGDTFVMPLTGMKLSVTSETVNPFLEFNGSVRVRGDYTAKLRRCILDAGIDVTVKLEGDEWKPVCVDGKVVTFEKDVMGIPEVLKCVAVREGKLKILSDVTFALSEVYIMLKKGLRTKYKAKLKVQPFN